MPIRIMRLRVSGLLLLGLSACGSKSGETPPFVLLRDSLGPVHAGRRVFLNEEIRVHFSTPVDPLTVTPDTVRLRDLSDGRLVSCKIAVLTRSISLIPTPPCRSDLSDGVLKLDRSYRLE